MHSFLSVVHLTIWNAKGTSLRYCAIKGEYYKKAVHSALYPNWPTLRLK